MKDMLARDEGSICFISSEAAIRSIGNMVPYSVTKNCHARAWTIAGRTDARYFGARQQLHAGDDCNRIG